jgi:hypothetical protein
VNDKNKVLSIQKGKRICDKGRKTVANLPEGFVNEACLFKLRMQQTNSWTVKIEQTHFISSLNKTRKSH